MPCPLRILPWWAYFFYDVVNFLVKLFAYIGERINIFIGVVSGMTNDQKQQIQHLRQMGLGYTKIAKEINLTVNTVKSFCYRNPLNETLETKSCCKQCGKPVEQNIKRREKKFCSNACRIKWWTCHHNELQHHKTLICVHCGKSFYGKPNRKYCSHRCYIAERFGESHVAKTV